MVQLVIPHRELLDEVSIALIPINLQLRDVSALLKWLGSIQETNDLTITHPNHWLAALNPNWTFLFEEKLQGLLHLQEVVNSLEKPLNELMSLLSDFSYFKELQNVIYHLQHVYSEIPYIETEVTLLSSECNILEQTQLLPTLLYYLDKVTSLVIKLEELKGATLHALLDTASHSFFPQEPLYPFQLKPVQEI